MKTTIHGLVPSKSNGYGIARNRLYKKKLTTAFEAAFKAQCTQPAACIEGEHAAHLVVYYDSKRPDLDGSFKVIMDCLQKQVNAIKNDNRTVIILAQKLIDKDDPRVEIELVAIPKYDYSQPTTNLRQVLNVENFPH